MSMESVTEEIQDQHTKLLNISHSSGVPCGANNCQVKLSPTATAGKQDCPHHYILENYED